MLDRDTLDLLIQQNDFNNRIESFKNGGQTNQTTRTPINSKLYARLKTQAKKKFKWPSQYAAYWIANQYKSKGGKYKYQDGGEVEDDLLSSFQEDNGINPYDEQDEFENEAPEQPEPEIQEEIYDALPTIEEDEDDMENYGMPYSKIDYDNIEPTLGHESHHSKEGGRITEILQHFQKDLGLKPSSVRGGKHNTGSKHYHGNALDLGINTTFGGDMSAMMRFKDYFLAEQSKGNPLYSKYKLIDET
ncbi:MAG: DUF5872 domain-containing protein, partial [Waterburya sp.]